jgi:hypothetical protein
MQTSNMATPASMREISFPYLNHVETNTRGVSQTEYIWGANSGPGKLPMVSPKQPMLSRDAPPP